VSKLLQKVTILNGDYSDTFRHIPKKGKAFFYFDPPYKPLSQSSSFNSYASQCFGDIEQERLKDFCIKLDRSGYHWLLSNSDLKNTEPENEFFDELYEDFNITRVKAIRKINSNALKRGEIYELLISNYPFLKTI
jgi:DNA adenine methylase